MSPLKTPAQKIPAQEIRLILCNRVFSTITTCLSTAHGSSSPYSSGSHSSLRSWVVCPHSHIEYSWAPPSTYWAPSPVSDTPRIPSCCHPPTPRSAPVLQRVIVWASQYDGLSSRFRIRDGWISVRVADGILWECRIISGSVSTTRQSTRIFVGGYCWSIRVWPVTIQATRSSRASQTPIVWISPHSSLWCYSTSQSPWVTPSTCPPSFSQGFSPLLTNSQPLTAFPDTSAALNHRFLVLWSEKIFKVSSVQALLWLAHRCWLKSMRERVWEWKGWLVGRCLWRTIGGRACRRLQCHEVGEGFEREVGRWRHPTR